MVDTLNIFGAEAILNAQSLSEAAELPLAHSPVEGWIGFGLLLFFFLCIRLIYRFFFQAKSELVHFHSALKHFEEHSMLPGGQRMVLMLLSAGITAFVLLLMYNCHHQFEAMPDSLERFLLIFAAVVAFFLLKTLLIYLSGYLSKTLPYMQIIAYYFHLHTIAGNLLLFLPLLFLFYRQDVWFNILPIATITIFVSASLLYLMRCWQVFNLTNVPVFFQILYLCTLEFVPFLIIYKYILSS